MTNNPSYLTTTISTVELCVAGEYDPPDLAMNWNGGFSINKIWIETDPKATDIQYLLDDVHIQQIEHEGYMAGHEDAAEKKATRDHANSLKFQPRMDDGTAYMDDEQ